MNLTRRNLLKIGGALAAEAVILPTDEQVRRFWPGWGGPKQQADEYVWVAGGLTGGKITIDPAAMTQLQAWDLIRVDGEIMMWDGKQFRRALVSTAFAPHAVPLTFQRIGADR